MSTATFLRLLHDEDKAQALAEQIAALREGRRLESMTYPVTYPVLPASFRQVPGSPFAYWVSERIRRLFTELPAFEGDGRTVKQGLATADDFRFVRAWWEVASEQILDGANEPNWQQDLAAFQAWCHQRTFEDKRWVPLAKGGAYSPYYADLHLVVNWERNGEEMKAWAGSLYGGSHWSRILKNTDFYFLPGLTWSERTAWFSLLPFPAGSIFSVSGKGLFTRESFYVVQAILGSSAANYFLRMYMARSGLEPKYQSGDIQRLPCPAFSNSSYTDIERLAKNCVALRRSIDRGNETSHVFHLPAVLQAPGETFAIRIAVWESMLAEADRQLSEWQREIDDIAFCLYGIDGQDRQAIEESLNEPRSETANESPAANSADEETEAEPRGDSRQLVTDVLSYAVGCVFGRWDVRFATGERQPPEPLDPFAPLPVSSTGMLIGEDGLPLREAPPGYPLRSDQDSILVDDPDNPDDIVRRVREVLEVLWHDRADTIEREACKILSVRELRDCFRRPGKGGFWDDHVSRYSKSRRKAPIYWLLQSSKKNYALCIYYHRFDKDMLFKALLNYVEPKIRLEESRLEPLRAQRTAAGTSGKGVKELEKEIDRQEEFISELRDFEDKLRRVANLHLAPDLNDGVVLNIAPLCELVPWKEAKKYWDELRDGRYEWSSIGKQLRQKGIAHSP